MPSVARSSLPPRCVGLPPAGRCRPRPKRNDQFLRQRCRMRALGEPPIRLAHRWPALHLWRYRGGVGALRQCPDRARRQAGDRVAVQVPKSIEALMLYLATLRVGAIFLPLNAGYTPAEVETFLVRCRAAAVRLRSRCRSRAAAGRRAGRGPARDPGRLAHPRCLGRHAGRPVALRHPQASSPSRATPTISRPCSTPREPPVAPRVRC